MPGLAGCGRGFDGLGLATRACARAHWQDGMGWITRADNPGPDRLWDYLSDHIPDHLPSLRPVVCPVLGLSLFPFLTLLSLHWVPYC